MGRKRTSAVKSQVVSATLERVYTSRVRQIDFQQEILAALYQTTRERGWQIKNFHWQTYPLSFHWVELEGDDASFSLLVEEGSPLAALCKSVPPVGEKLPFFDDPAFADAAERSWAPFTLMRAADLGADLTQADRSFVAQLSDQHAADMRYWKPASVGDVVFNFWD